MISISDDITGSFVSAEYVLLCDISHYDPELTGAVSCEYLSQTQKLRPGF